MSARVATLVVLAATACSDTVVDISFATPNDPTFSDTSCITTVEVYASGKNYPTDPDDYIGVPVTVDHPPTYADMISQIRGKFNVPIPPSGLQAIEIYGWNGDPQWDEQLLPAELVFFGRAPYGDDDVAVPIVPNISCKHSTVTVRPLDLVGFINGGFQCAAGAVPDGDPMAPPFADLGTFAPLLYAKNDVRYFGGKSRGIITGGVATIDGPTTVGPNSCLAVGTYTGAVDAISCAHTAGICGHTGEIEVAVLPDNFIVPPSPSGAYRGALVGAVFSTARQPIAGATVEIDPTIGEVKYVDLDVATMTFKIVGGNATTASGLFVVWTNKITEAQVTANGRTVTIPIASIGDDLSAEYLGTSIVVVQ